MEIAQKEIRSVEVAVKEAAEKEVSQLNDLELALVGGGIGSVIFA